MKLPVFIGVVFAAGFACGGLAFSGLARGRATTSRPEAPTAAVGIARRAESSTEVTRTAPFADWPAALASRSFREREAAVRLAAEHCPPENIASALASLADLPAGVLRREFARRLLSRWVEIAPAATVAWIRAQLPGAARQEYWTAALSTLATRDPVAALAVARTEVEGDAGRRLVAASYVAWARINGAEAMASASGSLAGQMRSNVLSAIVNEWAAAEPEAAIRWLQQRAGDPQQRALLAETLQGMARSEPELAAACLATCPDDTMTRQAAATLAVAWANQDLVAAVRWMEQLPAGGLREAALTSLLPAWIEQDPAAVAKEWDHGNFSERSLEQLGRTWASLDFAEAARWAESRSSAERETFVTALVTQRALDRPIEAVQLWRTLPAGPASNGAAVGLAASWAGRDPAAAADWARQLPDDATRVRVVQEILPMWATNDASQAWQWLQALPLGTLREAALAAYRSGVAVGGSE